MAGGGACGFTGAEIAECRPWRCRIGVLGGGGDKQYQRRELDGVAITGG